ncbi:hypothetical protein [Mannheimia indoligenes]|uniref:hypothetical protein n=1 Tax=Mannheimia indoligenes TaxID=3103145 RepID=UPI002FE61EC5
MIDIRNRDPAIISDELYNLVHQYAVLDFEVQKYSEKQADPNSPLTRIRLRYKQLYNELQKQQAAVIPTEGQYPLDIQYKLIYKEKEYLLDSEIIKAKIQLLG